MRFVIANVKNGFLLNVYYQDGTSGSFVYKLHERYRMFAEIDKLLGPIPVEDAKGQIIFELKGDKK